MVAGLDHIRKQAQIVSDMDKCELEWVCSSACEMIVHVALIPRSIGNAKI